MAQANEIERLKAKVQEMTDTFKKIRERDMLLSIKIEKCLYGNGIDAMEILKTIHSSLCKEENDKLKMQIEEEKNKALSDQKAYYEEKMVKILYQMDKNKENNALEIYKHQKQMSEMQINKAKTIELSTENDKDKKIEDLLLMQAKLQGNLLNKNKELKKFKEIVEYYEKHFKVK